MSPCQTVKTNFYIYIKTEFFLKKKLFCSLNVKSMKNCIFQIIVWSNGQNKYLRTNYLSNSNVVHVLSVFHKMGKFSILVGKIISSKLVTVWSYRKWDICLPWVGEGTDHLHICFHKLWNNTVLWYFIHRGFSVKAKIPR